MKQIDKKDNLQKDFLMINMQSPISSSSPDIIDSRYHLRMPPSSSKLLIHFFLIDKFGNFQ